MNQAVFLKNYSEWQIFTEISFPTEGFLSNFEIIEPKLIRFINSQSTSVDIKDQIMVYKVLAKENFLNYMK